MNISIINLFAAYRLLEIVGTQIKSHYHGRRVYLAYLHSVTNKDGLSNSKWLGSVVNYLKIPVVSILSLRAIM